MSVPLLATIRVLAIDPTSKGFGFAVLEGPGQLIDWGVKYIRGNNRNRNPRSLEVFARLIARYQPDVLVVEHTNANGCQRRQRTRQLIAAILDYASAQDLRTRQISRRRVQQCFSKIGTATKRQVAVSIAAIFPELESYLPPERKPWMSEDQRMSVFDAIAFGLVAFRSFRCSRQGDTSFVN